MKIFIDFEYNGQPNLETIQFGAVLVDNRTLTIDTFESLVKPKLPITRYVQKLTGITNEMVATAPDFLSVFSSFVSWVEDNTVGKLEFYAWGSDLKQLRRECKNNDCLTLYDELMKGNDSINYQKVVSKKIEYNNEMLTKSMSLSDVKALYSNTSKKVEHNALSDAIDTLWVYQEIEVLCRPYNEDVLKRIYSEKKKHMKKMSEDKTNQIVNSFKHLPEIYQKKSLVISNQIFNKLKSGPGCFFNEIAADVNDVKKFSRKRECEYKEGIVKLLITVAIDNDNKTVNVEFDGYFDSNYIGSHNFYVTLETRKFVSRLLTDNI